MTSQEKYYLKKAGKVYLKIIKAMGLLLIAGLILTAISVANAHPDGGVYHLQAGQSAYVTQFYGEKGEMIELGFGITKENGQDYTYPEMDQGTDLAEFMKTMDWKVQMVVEYSASLNFDHVKIVKDVSGEINFVNMELYQDGHYRVKITNLTENTLSVSAGKVETPIGWIIATVAVWIMFGIFVAIFSFMVHFAFWALIVFLVYKLVTMADDNHNGGHPNIIEPQQAYTEYRAP